jgi:DNA-binding response OmpR family regulator
MKTRGNNKMAKNILVVDDDRQIVSLVTRVLKKNSNYNISVAYNGQDGLDIAKSKYANNQKFDLLISDTIMPVMCGPEFIKEYKNTLDSKIKVFQMSGTEPKIDGVNDYISKPFDINEFYSRVEKLLLSD